MEIKNQIIPLGTMVVDSVTGLRGVVITEQRHLNGCLRYTVQPLVDKEGKIPDAYNFDSSQLVIVTQAGIVTQAVPHTDVDHGGPMTKAERY